MIVWQQFGLCKSIEKSIVGHVLADDLVLWLSSVLVTVNVAVQHSGATHDISQTNLSPKCQDTQTVTPDCLYWQYCSVSMFSLSLVLWQLLSMAFLLWQGFIEFVLYISNFHCFGALQLESGPEPWLGQMCWWAVIIGIYSYCIESEPKCLKRLGHCFFLNHE